MEKALDKTLDIIKELTSENIVLVNIVKRSSEGYYNYKTRYVAVYVPPPISPYEEQDILRVKEIKVFCGVFQEIEDCHSLIDKLRDLGFTIVER